MTIPEFCRKRYSLSIEVAKLEEKPVAAIDHFCKHIGKAHQRIKSRADGERQISDDGIRMLDPAMPESTLDIWALMSFPCALPKPRLY